MERRLRFGTALSFFVLAGLTILVGLLFFHPPRPSADALRYIDYAVNLHLHGVFGLSKGALGTATAPGNQNTPLYPAWIAAMMTLDPGLRESLLCIVQDRTQRAACPMHFGWFVSAQLLFASITVFAVWLLARRLTRSLLIAWTAAGFAILAEPPYGYANQFLTEAVLLPLFSLFILFLVLAYQDRKPAWLLAAGLILGLATLTRPGYEYLFYAVAIVLAVLAIRFRTKTAAASVVLFAVAFAVTVAPWMLRNKQHFGTLALTSQYGGAILAQRIAYNRMSWPEIATAFVHWFPDFGQKISGVLIAPRHYKKLTMGPAGYYQKDGPEVMRDAHANAGGPDAVVPYLIRTGIVAQPVKHVFVSAALTWRAIFISKYWGIAGFICFIAVVLHGARRGEYGLLIASLPVWFMVAFHAFATVSINRYNLPLIPIYATAMAIAVVGIGRALRGRWPVRQRASN